MSRFLWFSVYSGLQRSRSKNSSTIRKRCGFEFTS